MKTLCSDSFTIGVVENDLFKGIPISNGSAVRYLVSCINVNHKPKNEYLEEILRDFPDLKQINVFKEITKPSKEVRITDIG